MNEDIQKQREAVTEVEYYCPGCQMNFVVYHSGEDRNTHCIWDGSEVTPTGKTANIRGNDIISYENGVEVSRRPIPELIFKKLKEKND